MKIDRVDLENAGNERDTSVAIDVLRAFTTAAFAFDSGAIEIFPVSTIDEAFNLQKEIPESLLMGEMHGVPVEGFNLGNSPTEVSKFDLSGRRIIHRSTAGTQGIVKSAESKRILAASLCNVSATVSAIQSLAPNSLTLVETGVFEGGWGDEDRACGDAIEAILFGEEVAYASILERVKNSRSGSHFTDVDHRVFPASDLQLALQVDCFDFFMRVEREDGRLVMRRHDAAQAASERLTRSRRPCRWAPLAGSSADRLWRSA